MTQEVLPTCVGMVRRLGDPTPAETCSPHVRGDGPVRRGISGSSGVLPTCVGMVRQRRRLKLWGLRSPHVRGDGPDAEVRGPASCKFSPRAWGWSESRSRRALQMAVLPTCVGMVRAIPSVLRAMAFSPRAWGWSVQVCTTIAATERSPHVRGDGPLMAIRIREHLSVLPTCVGMVRHRISRGSEYVFSPRAWGWSGPRSGCHQRREFSPRAWGWSAAGR